jgi:hypothetical protein
MLKKPIGFRPEKNQPTINPMDGGFKAEWKGEDGDERDN